MTPPPAVVDNYGKAVPLGRQLGNRGGEGTVYALSNDQSRAAKIYHDPPSPQTVAKLTEMVRRANPQLIRWTAWPEGLLCDARTRKVAGFVMPLIRDFRAIQELYNPVQRLRCFPHATWHFQVRAAINLAAAFEKVHQAQCLVGDVNERNELVSAEKPLVRLIDCDSFQLRANGEQYLCEVGVEHYTPPELQGKSFRGLVRTENHDRFGLAVLIYQLLFAGRHPYAGVYRGAGDPPFQQLISEFRFAQGPEAHKWGMDPPPFTPTFDDIPPELGILFRRAFERGSEKGTRPSPLEWVSALNRLEQSIAKCSVDEGHGYWRGAKACVWCRLAEYGGPEYYFGVAPGVGTFAVDEAKLQDVLRRLNSCALFDFPYDRRRFMPSPDPDPEPLPAGVGEDRTTVTVLGVITGLCLLAMPLGLIHWAIFVATFLGALFDGILLVICISMSPWHSEYRRRKRACHLAHDELDHIENKWYGRVAHYHNEHSALNRALQPRVSDWRDLASQYQAELQRLTANAEAAARLRHLRLHQIADAEIPLIAAQRKQTLAAHNIFTAAEIDERVIRSIKGFGDATTVNLLAWKANILRQFQFNPTTAVSAAEQLPLTLKYRTLQQQLIVETDGQLDKLEKLAPACQAALQSLVPHIRNAVAIYEQAEADLSLMNGKR